MFSSKKKIVFTDEELRLIILAMNDFRNNCIRNNISVDAFNEIIPKLKNTIKVKSDDLDFLINGLDKKRDQLVLEKQDITLINMLLTKLLDLSDTFK